MLAWQHDVYIGMNCVMVFLCRGILFLLVSVGIWLRRPGVYSVEPGVRSKISFKSFFAQIEKSDLRLI